MRDIDAAAESSVSLSTSLSNAMAFAAALIVAANIMILARTPILSLDSSLPSFSSSATEPTRATSKMPITASPFHMSGHSSFPIATIEAAAAAINIATAMIVAASFGIRVIVVLFLDILPVSPRFLEICIMIAMRIPRTVATSTSFSVGTNESPTIATVRIRIDAAILSIVSAALALP